MSFEAALMKGDFQEAERMLKTGCYEYFNRLHILERVIWNPKPCQQSKDKAIDFVLDHFFDLNEPFPSEHTRNKRFLIFDSVLKLDREFKCTDRLLEKWFVGLDERLAGETILLRLISKREADEKAIEYILSKNPDINAKSDYGETALHIACDNHSPKVVDMLLRKGANTRILNKFGQTPCTMKGRLSFMVVNFGMEQRFIGIVARCLHTYQTRHNVMTEFLTQGVYDPRILIQVASFAYITAKL